MEEIDIYGGHSMEKIEAIDESYILKHLDSSNNLFLDLCKKRVNECMDKLSSSELIRFLMQEFSCPYNLFKEEKIDCGFKIECETCWEQYIENKGYKCLY